ncbi:MAG: hypothetical protein KIS73_23360 [Enhydrobacter sp.]|nr:hypothetical protein [Enhydrobacter sp.]
MTANEKDDITPRRERGARTDELEGASSHRSFHGARDPRSKTKEDPPSTEKNVVRPDEGELSPRD